MTADRPKRSKKGALTERVATLLLGTPSGIDPGKGKINFNDIVVDIVTGRFYDMEDEAGGDHLDLIRKFKRLENGQAEAWLEENVTKAARVMPKEHEAERILIGFLAMRPDLVAVIEEEITPDSFAVPLHKQLFDAIFHWTDPSKPLSSKRLLDAGGGDPLGPVPGCDGYTMATYIAKLIAEAPSEIPDAAHFVRSLAASIRSDANRDGDVHDDEYDLEAPPPPFESKFGGIPFELLDEPGPEHEHLIDGILTVGDKSIIGGASRSGKSFLAIDMAMSIATGRTFFGHKVMKPGLVVYQAGEGGRGIKKRFRAWRQYHQVDAAARIPVFILPAKVDIHSVDGDTGKLIEELAGIERLYNLPIVAFFIDTLAKASGVADENSGKDMGTVMGNVDRIAEAFPDMHVCLVHHMNAGGTKLRGHTSVHAGVDQVILVTRDEANPRIRTATLDKQKDEEDGAKIMFELQVITIGERAIDRAPITSCVPLPLGAEVNVTAKGPMMDRSQRLTTGQAVIFQALKDALADEGIPTPPTLRLPKSISRVVDVRHWKAHVRARAEDISDSGINKSMKAASEKLLFLRLIGRVNPYVWLTGRGNLNHDPAPVAGKVGPSDQAEFPET